MEYQSAAIQAIVANLAMREQYKMIISEYIIRLNEQTPITKQNRIN